MPNEHCNKRLEALEANAIECNTYRKLREKAEIESNERFNKKFESLQVDVTEIKEFMTQQKSFVGAVVLIVGSVFAVISVFADKIFK